MRAGPPTWQNIDKMKVSSVITQRSKVYNVNRSQRKELAEWISLLTTQLHFSINMAIIGWLELATAEAPCQSLIRGRGSWWTSPRGQTMPRTSSSTGWRASRLRRRMMLSTIWDMSWVSEDNNTHVMMMMTVFVMSGIHKDREDELEELMPSCFCLNLVDCITVRISSVFCRNKRWTMSLESCYLWWWLYGVTSQWYHGGKLSWCQMSCNCPWLLSPGSQGEQGAEITITHYDSSHLCAPLLDMVTLPGPHWRLLWTQNKTIQTLSPYHDQYFSALVTIWHLNTHIKLFSRLLFLGSPRALVTALAPVSWEIKCSS